MRAWQPGDSLVLDLEMPVRMIEPDARVDAVRGCVAFERGPLVYCVETADLPPGVALEELELEPAALPVPVPRPDVAESVIGLAVPATWRPRERAGRRAHERGPDDPGATAGPVPDEGTPVEIGAVPYFAWANRSVDAMRVWIPNGSGSGARARGDEAPD